MPAARGEKDADPLIGKVFDQRYRAESLIGRGGYGAVYRATQLAVDRPVALKVLHGRLAQHEEQLLRFEQEARAASRLQHHHCVRLHDFGRTEEGVLFLVTELLEGEPLSSLMKREGPLPPARAVRIACQALEALAEAHDAGLIHRDLKPDNLFMKCSRDGRDFVKVLDFGIAKVTQDGDMATLTRPGVVMGTPAYMSPEQARAEKVDVRSDLYSIGVVLYQMLSGVRPFTGKTPMEVLLLHMQTPAPPLTPPAGRPLPRALVDLVHRCLSKRPASRPQSADELRELLESALRDTTVDTRRDPAPALSIETPDGSSVELTVQWDPNETAFRPSPAPTGASIQAPGPTMPMRGTSKAAGAETGPATVPVPEAPDEPRRWWPVALGALLALGVLLLFSLGPRLSSEPDTPDRSTSESPARDAEVAAVGESADPPVADPAPRPSVAEAAGPETSPGSPVTATPPDLSLRRSSMLRESRRERGPPAISLRRPETARACLRRPVATAAVRPATPEPPSPVRTTVVLASTPAGTTVWSGSTRLGKAPLPIDLPPVGSLVVQVKRRGWMTRSVTLQAGESGVKTVVLRRRPRPRERPGRIEVDIK